MHLELAHEYWRRLLKPGDTVIDATCGNGKDTLFLAQLVGEQGQVVAMDIQNEAITNTRLRLKEFLSESHFKSIHLLQASHASFPPFLQNVQLIIYNLGYLPGGNKSITTLTAATLLSLQNALAILAEHGVVCITCYPGHLEGAHEEKAILEMAAKLNFEKWSVTHHRLLNRPRSPSVLFIQKKSKD